MYQNLRFSVFLLIVISVVFCCTGSAFAESRVVPGRYIVHFAQSRSSTSGLSRSQYIQNLQEVTKRNIARITRRLPVKDVTPLWIINSVALTASNDEIQAITRLPAVSHVSPVTYDIYLDLSHKPEPANNESAVQWSVAKVRAPEVWEKHNIDGTGIVVGVIDTGIFSEHPLLDGKTIAFKDFSGQNQKEAYDDQGHGTHVAGSIGAGGGVGVAPGVKFIVAKVFNKSGGTTTDALMSSMQWMMDPDGDPETNDGPMLVNNSWGSNNSTNRTFWNAVQAWVNAGILPVFAAGNDGRWGGRVGTPAAFPHSWAVAATTMTDTLAVFSSRGPVSWDGVSMVKPDIAAPGNGVISCSHKGGLVSNSGTSMACPHVAGLAALMLQADPSLTIDQIRQIAEETSVDLGTPGRDNHFGSGRFDALAAVEKVLETAVLASSIRLYENSLSAEAALLGFGAVSPLAEPIARSIIQRAQKLDQGQFNSFVGSLNEAQNPSVKALIRDVVSLRKAQELHAE